MKKVVLVVDSAIIAMEISTDLESEGYLVSYITNTLKEVLRKKYDMDLLIMDLEFLSTNHIDEIGCPILFLSNVPEPLISYGEISTLEVAYDFLYKPFTTEQLLRKTRQILEGYCKNSQKR